LVSAIEHLPNIQYWSLAERCNLAPSEIAADVDSFGVLRIVGMDRDVDIFRKPNELEIDDFDRVWKDATELQDGVRLPNALDLLITKMDTGRDRDTYDCSFLESLVAKRFSTLIAACDLSEAKAMIERFSNPQILGAAQTNPNADVRAYARGLLREFELEGDPFSRDILSAWQEPA
jgi:hypothetical protein